jgi:hypothetical protein
MASFGHTFDASAVEPLGNYDVLPPGKYVAQIVNSEMRPTKDGMGQYLYLELDILEGAARGRRLFDRINLVNSNPETVQIAQRTLSSICRAAGKLQVSNSEQLHLIALVLEVKIRPPKGQYGESNAIRYLPSSGVAPVQSAGSTAPQAVAPAAASGAMPWKRAV